MDIDNVIDPKQGQDLAQNNGIVAPPRLLHKKAVGMLETLAGWRSTYYEIGGLNTTDTVEVILEPGYTTLLK